MAFISRPQVSQGRNFLKYKKCKCSHTRDVLSLDINNENQLVTGSVDNVICFWNSFNGVESKKIVIPESIASLYKGQTLQYVRFPFKNKKDLIIIIINNGECYALETQSERFLEFNLEYSNEMDIMEASMSDGEDMGHSDYMNNNDILSNLSDEDHDFNLRSLPEKTSSRAPKSKRDQTNPYLMGKISKFPIIDLKSEYLVSVNENGRGMLHQIKYQSYKKISNLFLANQRSSRINLDSDINPISFQEVAKFKVSENPLDSTQSVFTIHICVEHDIFLTAQTIGQVTIFQLSSCNMLAVLNKGYVEIPESLKMGGTDQEKKQKSRKHSQQLSSTLAKQQYLYAKENTVPAPWSKKLKDSRTNNHAKFNSDILESLQMFHNPRQYVKQLASERHNLHPQAS